MNDWMNHSIYTREDGSYVINHYGGLYHVPNNAEFANLYQNVKDYTMKHPEQVYPEPKSEPPSLEELKKGLLMEFDFIMQYNDEKLIRPIANNDANIVAYINEIQRQNRELRQSVASITSVEALQAVKPVKVDFSVLVTAE